MHFKFKFIWVVMLCWTIAVDAQNVPPSIKYQTAVRDNSGNLLANSLVSLKFSLLRDNPNGLVIYVESHQVSTNDFGVASLNLGAGVASFGTFTDIDWSKGPYFLKTELDMNNGTNYLFMGTSQLLAVPYALYAAKSGNAENDYDKDSINEIQQIGLNGNQLQLTKSGGSVNLDKYIDNTDSQTISLQGNTLSISRGNSIVLAGAVDLDADPINEIQNLSIDKDTIKISKANYIILPKDNDTSSTNELQNLSRSGDTLSISKGNFVLLIRNNDRDSSNEIQTILRSNDTLYLSKSNFAVLPQNKIVPTGTILTLDTFDVSLLNKGYSYVGRSLQNIENKISDSASWQWHLPVSNDFLGGVRRTPAAVWLGNEMLILGDQPNLNSSTYLRKYNVSNDSWVGIPSINTPPSSASVLAVWTGIEVLVWAYNVDSNKIYRYNPQSNNWTFVIPSNPQNSPVGWSNPTAIWSGTDLIIWGGNPYPGSSGKKYNLLSNSWSDISNVNSPSKLSGHVAVWTGTEMIVWGGTLINSIDTLDKAIYKYNPISNSWSKTLGTNTPNVISGAKAVWTGSEMLVFGGFCNSDYCNESTYIYNPSMNKWSNISDFPNRGITSRGGHSMVWTGNEAIIWGGSKTFDVFNNGYRLKYMSPTFEVQKNTYYHVFRKN